MKKEDIGLDSFDGISKVEIDGVGESFYLIGLNTVRIKYVVDTGEIISLETNGVELPLDNPEVINQFKNALAQVKRSFSTEKKEISKIRKSELGLNAFTGVSHILGNGILETFYLIGVNNAVKVKYNANTDEVLSIVVNGSVLPLDNAEAVNDFKESVERASKEKTSVSIPKPQEKTVVKKKELGLNELNGVSHLCGNNIQETFYLVGINNSVRVKYNIDTDEVLDLVVNGKHVQLEKEQDIEDFRSIVKETVEHHSSTITKSSNAKPKIGDLGLGELDGLSRVDKDGIAETFYLIGVHNVRVKYDDMSRDLVSLTIDGRKINIDDPNSIENAVETIKAFKSSSQFHK